MDDVVQWCRYHNGPGNILTQLRKVGDEVACLGVQCATCKIWHVRFIGVSQFATSQAEAIGRLTPCFGERAGFYARFCWPHLFAQEAQP